MNMRKAGGKAKKMHMNGVADLDIIAAIRSGKIGTWLREGMISAR